MIKQKIVLYLFTFSIIGMSVFWGCKESSNNPEKETILTGNMNLSVDQTVQSLIEGQVTVFESQYKGKIAITAKSESEVVNDLLSGKTNMAVLTRKLTNEEERYFVNKKITPRISLFAYDAVVFVRSNKSNDTLLDLQEVDQLLHGKSSAIKNLVFENPNSSVVTYLNRWAKIQSMPKNGVFSLKSTREVLEFIDKNSDAIGVIGMDAIAEPYPEWLPLLEKVNVLAIKNVKSQPNSTAYYLPTQANLGEGLYPFRRPIYVLNYQGYAGLGTGFASFLMGDIGQRIVLRSNLLPVKIPERNIVTRKNINLK